MQPFNVPDPDAQNDTRRMLIAIVLVAMIWGLWQAVYTPPAPTVVPEKIAAPVAVPAATPEEQQATRAQTLQGDRLPIRSARLHGSLALTGARFDDVTLAKYRVDVNPKSPEIVLLSPSAAPQPYFVESGWLAADAATPVPDSGSVWKTDAREIRPNERVTLWWENGKGLRFEKHITLDDYYMFTIEQVVINQSQTPVQLVPYGRIQRSYMDNGQTHYAISHEGPVGVSNSELHELDYKKLTEDGAEHFDQTRGWLGFGDKYWLTALVPDSAQAARFNYSSVKDQPNRFQADYSGATETIAPAQTARHSVKLFAGAKEVAVLDSYTHAGVPLFDRAVDFGRLYFLTKPIFLLLNWFYGLVGSFGIAILLLTVVIKAIMFPLANKSYYSMNQMKRLQPEMERIKQRHGQDRMRFQQEVMALYKREKVNPASGCLPMLIQIPVFFALYKVLFVTIEMRHAPFYGWIQDLSAIDPSNVFTLFGLVDWNPPAMLHLGWWPLVMCLTMVVQQSMSPKPSDPIQAKVIGYMPYMFLFLFASFPAGLVIYWSWSNLLTIAQQYYITRKYAQLNADPVSSK